MSMFAGVAIWQMFAWLQSRQWRQFVAAGAGLTLLLFMLNLYTLEAFPVRMNDYIMLARYYDRGGNTAGSIRTMEQAVSLFEAAPKGDAAFEDTRKTAMFYGRGKLARSYIKMGRWQDAKEVLLPLIETDNHDDSLVLMMILAYTRLGENAAAAALARRMADKYPGNPKWQSVLESTANPRN